MAGKFPEKNVRSGVNGSKGKAISSDITKIDLGSEQVLFIVASKYLIFENLIVNVPQCTL